MDDEVIFFGGPEAFRRWLEEHHDERDVLWVGLFKTGTGRPTLSWSEAVDEALCFGWIDGLRMGIDDGRYKIRFTPRRKGSNWSRKNIASAERLIREGRMRPRGLEAFEAAAKSAYSFESEETRAFAPALLERFQAHAEAWERFNEQPPGYRRTLRFWVMSAKREATRLRRLVRLIEVSARGRRVDPMAPFKREV